MFGGFIQCNQNLKLVYFTYKECALVFWCVTVTTNMVREKKKKTSTAKIKNPTCKIEIYSKINM